MLELLLLGERLQPAQHKYTHANTTQPTQTQTQQDQPTKHEYTHENTTNANTTQTTNNKTNLLGTEPWLNDGTDGAAGGS